MRFGNRKRSLSKTEEIPVRRASKGKVAGLVGSKVSTRVVISHSVAVVVDSRRIISGLMVGLVGSGLVVSRGRGMVGRGMDGGCLVSRGRLVVSRGSMVHRGSPRVY